MSAMRYPNPNPNPNPNLKPSPNQVARLFQAAELRKQLVVGLAIQVSMQCVHARLAAIPAPEPRALQPEPEPEPEP